jgi:dolichol-phosphate mannosyltransferase
MSDYLLIVPTYNEESNIKEFLKQASDFKFDILLVDGNSTDDTPKIIQEYQAINSQIFIINQNSKSGLGGAYREGYSWALRRDYTYIIQMDADFSHTFKDLKKLVKFADVDKLIIGSRYIPGGSIIGWKKRRMYLSIYANKFTKLLKNSEINDLTTGFRIYHINILKNVSFLDTYSNGYSFQIEMALLTEKLYKVEEVPISFYERASGESKMNFKIVLEAIFFLLKRSKK